MSAIVGVIGFISGVVSLVVFVTGKPSLGHFFPLGPSARMSLPSPFVRWRFRVHDGTLFLLTGAGTEVALLPELQYVGDYRIFVSNGRKKVLVVYHGAGGIFSQLLVANSDGSSRQVHEFPGATIVDARWFSADTYLVFAHWGGLFDYYPKEWSAAGQPAIEEHIYNARIKDGNFLVTLDERNQVTKLQRY
jgi:hypothetical protein